MDIVAIVPFYHDPTASASSRKNRHRQLLTCLTSLCAAAKYCDELSQPSVGIRIALIDDRSPVDIADSLRCAGGARVSVLRNNGERGQAGALNFAMANIHADVFAFTDSDCVVQLDWFAELLEFFKSESEFGGVAGPYWRFSPTEGLWSRLLTCHESYLMEFLAIGRSCCTPSCATKIDCRNMALRAAYARSLMLDDALFRAGSYSVSGLASYLVQKKIGQGAARVGYRTTLLAYHAPIVSLFAQIKTYYARGRGSELGDVYSSQFGGIFAAWTNRYGRRHFLDPILQRPTSAIYILLVHGAYWAGILIRRLKDRSQSQNPAGDTETPPPVRDK